MKQLFTLFALLTISWAVNAQCTPNPAYTSPGYYPDTIADGTESTFYSFTLTAVIPNDTVVSGFTVPIDSVVLNNVLGLPPSLTYACNPNSCTFPGGSTGCILVSGTPDAGTAGDYHIQGDVTIHITLFGTPQAVNGAVDFDTLHIEPFVGSIDAAGSATNVCEGETTTFTNMSSGVITTYDWDFGDGNSSSMTNPTHTYASAGSYNWTLIVSDGVIADTAHGTAVVHANPTAMATASVDSICMGTGSASLMTSGGTTYSWSPSTGLSDAGSMNPTVDSIAASTRYVVTVTDVNGCSDTAGVWVYVKDCSVGFTDPKAFEQILLYPNPTSDYLNIELSLQGSSAMDIQMTNQLGQVVFAESTNETDYFKNRVPIMDWPAGVYVLSIRTEQGIASRQVIIE